MNSVIDRLRALFDRLWAMTRDLMGLDRVRKSRRRTDLADRSAIGRIAYFLRPALALAVVLYTALLFVKFTLIHGDELTFPQRVFTDQAYVVPPGQRIPSPQQGGPICEPSQIVAVTSYILDVLVNQNTWVPSDPQYKIGFFGVITFHSTPFFDNKAHFQVGALRAVRRVSIELADLLGRARGTSAADPRLEDARSSVQWNERAWVINPFDERLQLISASATASYRNAIRALDDYNMRLSQCNATFDSRSDNLFQFLDRIANDIGGIADELARRSKADRWDITTKTFVPGEGNNRGFFDFRADDLFYRAHGLMWAYHGILQAARIDFGGIIQGANLARVWDRMEQHVAEAAAMKPLIVSNGAEDSLFTPDHLSLLAANMLRAHANLQELREIIRN
jgi:hypothetical protein